MRTQEEIVQRIKDKQDQDFLGVIAGDLAVYLDFEHVKEFLKPGVTEWEQYPLTEEAVKKRIAEYMPFAIGKAEDERGISASRSIQHFESWLWLLGDEETIDNENYAPYGKPILRAICEKYGLKWSTEEVV